MRMNPGLVKRSLDAHSAIGLVVGGLMYLICLTGTLAAIAETFERWEQPSIPEFSHAQTGAVENAMNRFRKEINENPESIWVVFPTAEIPRMHVSDGQQERFTDAVGNLLAEPVEGWTHMLRELHISLHLPHNIGLVIVSAIGAMLVALIVSGLLAHPRLFKDAFKFRLGGSRRLEQADIHNRLSVWGLPFHIMIATTGAFYGLVGILVFSAATAWYESDTNALFDAVYGADPVLEAPAQKLDTARAMSELKARHPDVSPIYLVAHQLDTPAQFMEIAATVPGRLAYSEIYRFNADGSYLGSQQLTSGPGARQFLYSLYRVHFGYFGGQATRILWFILGLALTVVSVSGINIWLTKRARNDWLDRTWCGLVWGTPLALVLSAAGAVFTALSPLAIFLSVVVTSALVAGRQRNLPACRALLQATCGACLALLAIAHLLNYPPTQFGHYLFWLNGGLLLAAAILAVLAHRSHRVFRDPAADAIPVTIA
ncbi:PepSY-associated TM helix domain-containing protein [Pseudohalioglobus lutimaris]|uniref:PepSY domain-containing protein n=1 Tax=Pseudohalioglobus lutimaris TaxID=1737061 RepID=A0A2N5X452_9GAMM|nr:PepSY-associated TM helix domain-containing protein [Pseudohalioglobus lutimaris]PLW69271.1 hypothetical protein C0039_09450 [Pseudohalioglobus lutimaris]